MSRFELVDSGAAIFRERLEKIIQPSSLSLEESYSLASTLNLLRNRLGGTCSIIESDYIDADYQSQYSFWYSKSFKRISNLCHRIHFFTNSCTLNQIAAGDVGEDEYLGYVVLTPLTTGRVGRTVVKPWSNTLELNGDMCAPSILAAESTAHLFGTTLRVKGFPYTSQDAMVMVCAQSSIWMAIQYMHNRYSMYGIKRHYPDDITLAATRYLLWGGRILPSGGLTQFHIVNALSNLDYQPIIESPPTNPLDWDPINWIVKYLDSEIPIVLTLSQPPHAIVVVGALHGSRESSALPNSSIVGFHHWTRGLIVNDDNLGPYKVMPLTNGEFAGFRSSYEDFLPHTRTWKSMEQIDGVIIPLPKEISLQARHIDSWVADILSMAPDNSIIRRLVSGSTEGTSDLLYFLAGLDSRIANSRIVTRAYLIRSMEYLRKIKGKYPQQLCEYYNEQQYPLYIWVVELTTQMQMQDSRPGSRKIYGEIIFDSTANQYDPCWLSVHIAGRLVHRDPNSEKIGSKDLPGVGTYQSHKEI